MTTPWPARPPRPAWWPLASPRWAACCTASSWTMPRWAPGSGHSGHGAQWRGREARRDRPPRGCRAILTEATRAILQADRTTPSVTEPPPARPAVGRPALPSRWGERAHRPGRERGCSKGRDTDVTPEPGVGWGGGAGRGRKGREGSQGGSAAQRAASRRQHLPGPEWGGGRQAPSWQGPGVGTWFPRTPPRLAPKRPAWPPPHKLV